MAGQIIDGEARDIILTQQGENEADTTPLSPEYDSYQSLVRLLVGGAVAGLDILSQRMRDWEENHPAGEKPKLQINEESESDLARFALIGLAFRSSEAARRGVKAVLGVTKTAVSVGAAPIDILSRSRPLRIFRNQFESLAKRGQSEVEDWMRIGKSEEQRSRQLAEYTFGQVTDQVIAYLSTRPELQELVKEQVDLLADDQETTPQLDALVQKLAGNYLAYLQSNPNQVQSLIRDQGDTYIGYLNENPKEVQTLIQGQSLSLIGEVRDEVRERGVTADNSIEMLARAILKRKPRKDLPEPQEEVKIRAERAYLEQDFKRSS